MSFIRWKGPMMEGKKHEVALSIETLVILQKKAHVGESYSDVLRRLLKLPTEPKPTGTEAHVVRLDPDVYAAVAKHGKFGDTFDDVLKRLMIPTPQATPAPVPAFAVRAGTPQRTPTANAQGHKAFKSTWNSLQTRLKAGCIIPNWTVLKGYVGENFTIDAVAESAINVELPTDQKLLSVPKGDFEKVHHIWAEYLSGECTRSEITPITGYSKYIISILHWLDVQRAK